MTEKEEEEGEEERDVKGMRAGAGLKGRRIWGDGGGREGRRERVDDEDGE